uniref:Uncharacterized protein n=1 Tax=Romanomermis culicivorax TaxID=13658 RepID=A0A915IB36_ROMCU
MCLRQQTNAWSGFTLQHCGFSSIESYHVYRKTEGITNRRNPHPDADDGYGLIGGCGYGWRMRNPHIRSLIGG